MTDDSPSVPTADTPPGTPRRTRLIVGLATALLLLTGLGLWLWTSTSPVAPAAVEAPVTESHPAALAETRGEEGTLQIEVLALERLSGGTVQLRMAVTHVGPAETPLDISQRFSADGPDRGTLAEVYLADLGHQRKLFILRDEDGAPIGSRDAQPLSPLERRVLWARYPAPADDEHALVVHVPHAEPMPNVPLSAQERIDAPAPATEPGG